MCNSTLTSNKSSCGSSMSTTACSIDNDSTKTSMTAQPEEHHIRTGTSPSPRVTSLLAAARCVAAVARLSLGPLLPLLSRELGWNDGSSKARLLSAYSSGYIVTQIVGGVLADRYGPFAVIEVVMFLSACAMAFLCTSSKGWIAAFCLMGLVAGPLYPAGSSAVGRFVPQNRAGAALAWVDAAAAAGTTVAALAPVIAQVTGSWRTVFAATAVGLVIVGVWSNSMRRSLLSRNPRGGECSAATNNMTQARESSTPPTSASEASNNTARAVWSPTAVCVYLCHSVDNFTKYSINAWAATLWTDQFQASPATVGTLLAAQEALGVISRLAWGTLLSSSPGGVGGQARQHQGRAITSAVAFAIQGLALAAAFGALDARIAASGLLICSLAVGGHSRGFRPLYVEAVPSSTVGAVAGVGNTIASMASAIGPVLVASQLSNGGWKQVGGTMMLINWIIGTGASLAIVLIAQRRRRRCSSSRETRRRKQS